MSQEELRSGGFQRLGRRTGDSPASRWAAEQERKRSDQARKIYALLSEAGILHDYLKLNGAV